MLERPKIQFDLVGHRAIWYAISLVTILAGIAFYYIRGGLNWGIDFMGGALLQYSFPQALGTRAQLPEVIKQARRGFVEAGLPSEIQIQVADNNLLMVRVHAKSQDEADAASAKILSTLEKDFAPKYGKPVPAAAEMVSPVIGRELKVKAGWALFLGCLLIVLYITIRYEFRFAVCGIAALLHDVLVMFGGVAIAQVPLNSEMVAALLTIVGYSIHDTIVIFDRIRENLRLRRGEDFALVVNDSLLQTMARSVNTVLTVLLVLIALFLFGGAPIHGFTFALLVGITSGAYSSIFNASQLLVSWDNWSRARGRRARELPRVRTRVVTAESAAARAASRSRSGEGERVPVAGAVGQEAEADESETPEGPAVRPRATIKVAPRPKTKRKAAGKRRKRF